MEQWKWIKVPSVSSVSAGTICIATAGSDPRTPVYTLCPRSKVSCIYIDRSTSTYQVNYILVPRINNCTFQLTFLQCHKVAKGYSSQTLVHANYRRSADAVQEFP